MKSCSSTLGAHKKEMTKIMQDWDGLPNLPRRKIGSKCLQALLHRKDPFYHSEGLFDFDDHPIKIIPYPQNKYTPDWSDIVSDILKIPDGTEASTIDCFRPSTGKTETGPTSGCKIHESLMHYLAKRTQDTYKDVVLPLSAPTSHDHLTMAHLGVGRMDMTRLVPPWFHAAGETFIPDPLGWKSALVLEGSSTPVHHDHMLAGQVTFHSFGHKIWILCPPNKHNMEMWTPHHIHRTGDQTKLFIENSMGRKTTTEKENKVINLLVRLRQPMKGFMKAIPRDTHLF